MTNEERKAVVEYRIENAKNTLQEVYDHLERGHYNTAVNRMYYACFYASTALLTAYGIESKSHEGVRQMIGKHFVVTQKIPIYLAKAYSLIYNRRIAGDYNDFFKNDKAIVEELLPQAHNYIKAIIELISDK